MRSFAKHGWKNCPSLKPLVVGAGILFAAGCGGDGSSVTGLQLETVVGTYSLTELFFDPQGALPETDILEALGTAPELRVTANKEAQIVYQDPVTGFFTTISAAAKTTQTALRLTFAGNSVYADLLLSRTMDFSFSEASGTLSFNDDSASGVRRQKLIRLVPALESEQLFDPVPGRLRVTFQRQ